MPTSAFHAFGGLEAGGWVFSEGAGYHVHQGYVYLSGLIDNSGGTVSETLLSGIPSDLRPSSDVGVLLPIDPLFTSFAANPVLNLPIQWAATMHTDGTLTLDSSVPAQINTAPTIADWFYVTYPTGTSDPPSTAAQYAAKLNVSLFLGSVRWPLPGTPPPDVYPHPSLASYLDTDFENIDATWNAHGSRVHLDGSVRALVDGASALLATLPNRVGLPADGATTADHSATFGIHVRSDVHNDAHIDSERWPVVPRADNPPLSLKSPPWLSGTHPIGVENFVTPISAITDGAGAYTGYDRLGARYLRNDAPYFTCVTSHHDGVFHIDYGSMPVAPGPSFSFALSDLVALCSPAPDWFAVHLTVTVDGPFSYDTHCVLKDFFGAELALMPPNSGIGDEENVLFSGYPVGWAGEMEVAGGEILHTDGSLWTPDSDSAIGQYSVWVVPGTPEFAGTFVEYPTTTDALPTTFWWNADQATTEIVVDWPNTEGNKLGSTNPQLVGAFTPPYTPYITWQAQIVPRWNLRQDALRAGDILDLTGAGWAGVTDVTSLVATGPPTVGIVPYD